MAAQSEARAINLGPLPDKTPVSGVDLSKRLQKTLLKLKGKFMSEDGKAVDYVKMKSSPEFAEYKKEAMDLQRVDVTTLSEVEKKVFFLNIYNSLTIHGLLEQPTLPDSVLKVQHFFKTTAYNIGGFVFSLDDIEHGILRCNRSGPASVKPQFVSNDPRLKFICKKLDPRIHFALVCGAKVKQDAKKPNLELEPSCMSRARASGDRVIYIRPNQQ